MTDFLVRRFVKEYEKTDNADVRTSYGILSSIVGICCNILLFTAKLLIGAGMNSLAIMADTSASQSVGIIGMIPPDETTAYHSLGTARYSHRPQ